MEMRGKLRDKRETHTDTQTHRHTDTKTDRQKHRQTQTERRGLAEADKKQRE